jgi:hypoxanthine-DNA glycosylase
LEHPFEPFFDPNSRILIVGTFPSIKSRESGFYYGHPRNRFWEVVSYLAHHPQPQTVADKKHLLLKNKIALADVLQSCDIEGSGDHRIRNRVPASLEILFAQTAIQHVYANGEKAYQWFLEYFHKTRDIVKLPSTSPANASYNLAKLLSIWKQTMEVL